MSDLTSDSDREGVNAVCSNVKKRKRTGKMTDVMKKLRASSHESGQDCKCTRFKCFKTISPDERQRIISHFNQLGDYNAQSKYLSGLITLVPVQRRRNRKDEAEANFHTSSYCYRVRAHVENKLQDVSVCYKAFLSLHGISNRRLQSLKKNLCEFGDAKSDGRGKHKNRPHRLTDVTKLKVMEFIKSLKGRKSHYSIRDSSKVYLPEELNIAKLHRMYNESNKENQVGYTTFREIFENNFNISFGFPRKDTCSTCDILKGEIAILEEEIAQCMDEKTKKTKKKTIDQKNDEKKLHLARSDKFYFLKRKYRKQSQKEAKMEAIVMDYQKNLPTPNITTSDVYYRRQLNFISFNIHVLSDSTSVFYTYDESVARKGADDVCSMLNHFLLNLLDPQVRDLIIFCDSCAGQNKNYTVIRFLHYIVHKINRFNSVKVVFPIRGHSYLECDKNMSLVNTKSYTETPEEWREILRNSRIKPSPFRVINCGDEVKFQNWTEFLSQSYVQKCPMPSRPIRVLKVDKNEPRFISHKMNYFGNYLKAVIVPLQKQKKGQRKKSLGSIALKNIYDGPVPIKAAKVEDLLHLTKFLTSPEAKSFYEALVSDSETKEDVSDIEFADDPLID